MPESNALGNGLSTWDDCWVARADLHPERHVASEEPADRGGALESLTAPDFALPDLAGATWTLSQHRGKKVLLATWASW